MQDVAYYLENTIGLGARIERYNGDFKSLPVYIRETYVLYNWLMDRALIFYTLTAIDRKKLIGKRINFVVPGKQLFLPSLVDDSKKEKMLGFPLPIHDLWDKALPHMVTPVLKTVYVDKRLPQFELHCNLGALAEYTSINFPQQEYYVVKRNIYYGLQKQGVLENENSKEGAYCLEVWKYEPQILARGKFYVNPLSLYLSLRNTKDERTQMALEEIIKNYTW